MISLSILCCTFFLSLLHAQTEGRRSPIPTKPVAGPVSTEVDAYLLRWEKEVAKVQGFYATCGWTEKSFASGVKKIFQGAVYFMKPNRFFLYAYKYDPVLKKQDKKDFVRVVCSGNYIYQFVPAQKEVHVYKATNLAKGQQGQNKNVLEFFFGMKAKSVKERFHVKLAKTDKHFIYFDITPKTSTDKGTFNKARLVFSKTTMLPRQFWFQQPNKDQVLWDIPKMMPNAKIDAKTFQLDLKGLQKAGWKLIRKDTRTDVKRPRVRPQKP